MANPEHVDIVRNGSAAISDWRAVHPLITLDLDDAHLDGLDLRNAHLVGARMARVSLRNALLSGAFLIQANLSRAVLASACLRGADLCNANLRDADLRSANLERTMLRDARLNRANLFAASLSQADISQGDLREATITRGVLKGAILDDADLRMADLTAADLRDVSLTGAQISGAALPDARLTSAALNNATFVGANMQRADMTHACLNYARFTRADLSHVKLCSATANGADFSEATLVEADLSWGDFTQARLCGADLAGAILENTTLSDVDFSETVNLHSVKHLGPSSIGIDTIFRSEPRLPDVFLRGCGIPEVVITYMPSLLSTGIDFYSTFISYSHKDEDFAKRLHSELQEEKLRVWYAPEDIAGGKKLHDQIFDAIRVHDKLLIVLSEWSMSSEWVTTEIRRARKRERDEGRQVLFPIRLVEWDKVTAWECFDADSGKDLAVELREYYIPDFSDWKDHNKFEAEFAKLLRDLKHPRPKEESARKDAE